MSTATEVVIPTAVEGYALAGLSYGDPTSPKKVLGLHGWTDNAATHSQMASTLTDRGWHLVSIDLGGHGRSSQRHGTGQYFAVQYVCDAVWAMEGLGWIPRAVGAPPLSSPQDAIAAASIDTAQDGVPTVLPMFDEKGTKGVPLRTVPLW